LASAFEVLIKIAPPFPVALPPEGAVQEVNTLSVMFNVPPLPPPVRTPEIAPPPLAASCTTELVKLHDESSIVFTVSPRVSCTEPPSPAARVTVVKFVSVSVIAAALSAERIAALALLELAKSDEVMDSAPLDFISISPVVALVFTFASVTDARVAVADPLRAIIALSLNVYAELHERESIVTLPASALTKEKPDVCTPLATTEQL
jgi:hypothetical protein